MNRPSRTCPASDGPGSCGAVGRPALAQRRRAASSTSTMWVYPHANGDFDEGYPRRQGPTALTVFFRRTRAPSAFPPTAPAGTLSVRLLGYKQVESLLPGDLATLLMRPEAQPGRLPRPPIRPTLRWDHPATRDREALIDTCVGCHQLPAPEVRA